MLDTYVLNKTRRFRVGNYSFELAKGTKIKMSQEDLSRYQVLLDFGDGLTEWFHKSVLEKNFSKLEQEEEQ